MMNKMRHEKNMAVFESDFFGKVRCVERDGEPWFVAKDVCDCLGLKNSSKAVSDMELRLKGASLKGVSSTYTLQTAGGPQKMQIVNEQGLYELTFASRKKKAIQFRSWVTGEVLPALRMNGGYIRSDATSEQLDNLEAHIHNLKIECDHYKVLAGQAMDLAKNWQIGRAHV